MGHHQAVYLLKHIKGYTLAFTKLKSQFLKFSCFLHIAIFVIN